MFDDLTPREMYKILKEARADIMLSGGRTQFVALKARCLARYQPGTPSRVCRISRHGGLVHEIDKALHNPVWEQVRRPAPWETRRPSSTPHRDAHGNRLQFQKSVHSQSVEDEPAHWRSAGVHGNPGCMPMLHGSQGCTSFGLVLLVRHFREAIPLQTTAMSEVATVLGGFRMSSRRSSISINAPGRRSSASVPRESPKSKATTWTASQVDSRCAIRNSISRPGQCVDSGFQRRFPGRVVERRSRAWWSSWWKPRRRMPVRGAQLNVLPGSHLTPGRPGRTAGDHRGIWPGDHFSTRLSGSLDGHIPDEFTPTTIGGVGVEEIRGMGSSCSDSRGR